MLKKFGGYDNNSENRVLEYRRWDDFIKSLHEKLDDISADMEFMFIDPLKLNVVSYKFLVLVAKHKTYIISDEDEKKDIYSRILKIYHALNKEDYRTYIKNNQTKNVNKALFDKRTADARLDLLELWSEINDSLAQNELNPKPLVIVKKDKGKALIS